MKRLFPILALLLLSIAVSAQPKPFPHERHSDEEIIQMQIRDIVSWLNLDKRAENRFIKEYTSFRKEINAIARNARPPQDIRNESEIDKAIQQNFAVSEQILQIRKKYYSIFKEFMKPSQIQEMYHIENEAGRRFHEGPRGPEGPGGPDSHENGPMPPHPGINERGF